MRHVLILTAALGFQGMATDPAVGQTPPRAITGVACPVTQPPAETEVAHEPFAAWRHGSRTFGVFLPHDGRWHGMAAEHNFRNKVFWYRAGFDGRTEPQPNLVVHGRRLDGSAAPVMISKATNAHHEDFGGWAMLTMVEFPEAGCWEVTGEYGRDTVSFVVRVDR